MQWVPGTAPPLLPGVVFVRVPGYTDPPHFSETCVTRGGQHIDTSDIVPIRLMEPFDNHLPVVGRSRGAAQGTGHACCIILQVPLMFSCGIPHRKRQGFILNLAAMDIDRQ